MLPERYIRLISAYVDGELPSQHRKMARRLLRRSSRARSLYRELRINAKRLGALPKPSLGPEFAPQVLQAVKTLATPATVAARASIAQPSAIRPRLRKLGNLAGAVAAASVLIAVATAAYLLFEPRRPQNPPFASSEEDKLLPVREPQEPVLPGDRIALSDPLLEKEFAKSASLHLEIPCRHNAEAVADLRSSFKENGVRLLLDPAANLDAGEVVVYAENLRADELVAILRDQPQFDVVFMNPITKEDRRILAQRFGVAADAFNAPPRASLELKKMIPKSGMPERVMPSPQADRFAVVLAPSPQASNALSQELRQFVESRRPQPGTLQVMLVLHEVRT